MSVYVGVPMWPYRSFIMCHMLADTEEELDEMAKKIGLRTSWKQPPTDSHDFSHYDIAKSKRNLAIKHGAIPLDTIEEEVDVLDRLGNAS
jgi:hypothetical protein